MRNTRAFRLAALALAALTAVAPVPVSAHTAGAAPIPTSGSVVLEPATPNSTANQLHVFVEQGLGLPVSPRDTLAYNWSANGGLGPAIEFTLHNHLNGGVTFVDETATNSSGSWVVTENLTLMVSFFNPTAYAVNVTYSFTLFAPPVVFSPAFFLLPAAGGIALGWFLWVRAGRSPEEGGLAEAYPTDPAARRGRPDEEE